MDDRHREQLVQIGKRLNFIRDYLDLIANHDLQWLHRSQASTFMAASDLLERLHGDIAEDLTEK